MKLTHSYNFARSRTLSVSYGAPGGPMANSSSGALSPGGHGEGQRSSVSAMPEELTLDYTEINSIPPLPLWTLLGKKHYFRFANGIRIS